MISPDNAAANLTTDFYLRLNPTEQMQLPWLYPQQLPPQFSLHILRSLLNSLIGSSGSAPTAAVVACTGQSAVNAAKADSRRLRDHDAGNRPRLRLSRRRSTMTLMSGTSLCMCQYGRFYAGGDEGGADHCGAEPGLGR
jgi:hypothetical protein